DDASLGWRLKDAMARIVRERSGIIVVLLGQQTPRDLVRMIDDLGQVSDDLADRRAPAGALRTYGVGAQILRELGVQRMRVLSAPKQMHAISGFGLEVVDYVDDQESSQ
ncbi:MAG: bifunctional 3,4-dihydroxy-2-butanone-4-phosphate synthase/GTP cyclohydrolase II, partial [Pseudomonadota bacterium]